MTLKPNSGEDCWDFLVDGTSLPLSVITFLIASEEEEENGGTDRSILQIEPHGQSYGGFIDSQFDRKGKD